MDYRLHFLGHEGRIDRTIELQAESDDEAIGLAEEHMTDGEPIELWRRDRKVCEFPSLTSTGRGAT